MGLDIVRFIEIKQQDGSWKNFDFKEKKDPDDGNVSVFGFGRNMSEYWLEPHSNEFEYGLPKDCDSDYKERYENWGCDFRYITLHDLEKLRIRYEHETLSLLKNSFKLDKKIDQILSILKNKEVDQLKEDDEDEEYFEYDYNDYEIKDKFDDNYAVWMLKLSILQEDIDYINCLKDLFLDDLYVPSSDIRIIYAYNV